MHTRTIQSQRSDETTPGSGEARIHSINWVIPALLAASAVLFVLSATVLGWMAASQQNWSTDPDIPAADRMWGHIIQSSTMGVMLAFAGIIAGAVGLVCWFFCRKLRYVEAKQDAILKGMLAADRRGRAAQGGALRHITKTVAEVAQAVEQRHVTQTRILAVVEDTNGVVRQAADAVAANRQGIRRIEHAQQSKASGGNRRRPPKNRTGDHDAVSPSAADVTAYLVAREDLKREQREWGS